MSQKVVTVGLLAGLIAVNSATLALKKSNPPAATTPSTSINAATPPIFSEQATEPIIPTALPTEEMITDVSDPFGAPGGTSTPIARTTPTQAVSTSGDTVVTGKLVLEDGEPIGAGIVDFSSIEILNSIPMTDNDNGGFRILDAQPGENLTVRFHSVNGQTLISTKIVTIHEGKTNDLGTLVMGTNPFPQEIQ